MAVVVSDDCSLYSLMLKVLPALAMGNTHADTLLIRYTLEKVPFLMETNGYFYYQLKGFINLSFDHLIFGCIKQQKTVTCCPRWSQQKTCFVQPTLQTWNCLKLPKYLPIDWLINWLIVAALIKSKFLICLCLSKIVLWGVCELKLNLPSSRQLCYHRPWSEHSPSGAPIGAAFYRSRTSCRGS